MREIYYRQENTIKSRVGRDYKWPKQPKFTQGHNFNQLYHICDGTLETVYYRELRVSIAKWARLLVLLYGDTDGLSNLVRFASVQFRNSIHTVTL